MFQPNSIKHLKDLKGHKDISSGTLNDSLSDVRSNSADPNDPIGFATITKNNLQEMDQDIEKIRIWRQQEKDKLQQKIQENKKNLELQRNMQLKERYTKDESSDDDEIQQKQKEYLNEYSKQLDNKNLNSLKANVLFEKIDPTLNGKIDESEQRLLEMQDNYNRLNFVEPDEIKQLKANLLKNLNLDFKFDEKEEKEEKFDLNKYKKMAEEFDVKEKKKKQYLIDIEAELQELEKLVK